MKHIVEGPICSSRFLAHWTKSPRVITNTRIVSSGFSPPSSAHTIFLYITRLQCCSNGIQRSRQTALPKKDSYVHLVYLCSVFAHSGLEIQLLTICLSSLCGHLYVLGVHCGNSMRSKLWWKIVRVLDEALSTRCSERLTQKHFLPNKPRVDFRKNLQQLSTPFF